ncbi:MAG: ATP/GTP-binding protein [Methanomassiliicoccales archaeon]|nr:ATP/GTP-binding protein [Methanomassiliicoccales archaeon]
MRNIYFIGTAGSGKSTLTYAFHDWLELQGIDSIVVNLDPGAEAVPYTPDVDIRDWIRLNEIMNEYGLGPNGAQIVCADLIALNVKEVVSTVEEFRTNYVLIDTPGQMELFAFRQSSMVVVDEFGREDSFLVFLSDPQLAKTPSGFVSDLMLCAITHFRFAIPILNVLSKIDTLTEEELETIMNWSRDPYALNNALGEAHGVTQSLLSLELFKALENIGMYKELIPVSAEMPYGMEDIYNAIQQYFAGGEDLTKD